MATKLNIECIDLCSGCRENASATEASPNALSLSYATAVFLNVSGMRFAIVPANFLFNYNKISINLIVSFYFFKNAIGYMYGLLIKYPCSSTSSFVKTRNLILSLLSIARF